MLHGPYTCKGPLVRTMIKTMLFKLALMGGENITIGPTDIIDGWIVGIGYGWLERD